MLLQTGLQLYNFVIANPPMKKLLFISIILCATVNGFATNYYFSATGNDGNAGHYPS